MPSETPIKSKLPHTGTTIFTIMSAMASAHHAINLSQGFPDFPVPHELIHLVNQYMRKGHNQYAPMAGVPKLLEALYEKVSESFAYEAKKTSAITITAGATEGLFASIMALVHTGDEVIVFDPAYDSYAPAIKLAGGKAVHIPLNYPTFSIDWDKVKTAISPKTKLIIINTPHNPSGAVLSHNDIQELERLVKANDELFILSDEVYEHIIFDGKRHESILRSDILREKGVAVFSFGKTFHATGWKVGYLVSPFAINEEIQKIHQFLTFSVNTAVQYALADYLKEKDHYTRLSRLYQEKRDYFLTLIKKSNFEIIPGSGTYFQLLSYKKISQLADVEMATWLTKEKGVAAIPVSVFYSQKPDQQLLRFCFAKNNETLEKAAKILCKI